MEHYLDNAATMQVLDTAAQAAMNAMTRDFGNPSSQHELGKRARDLLEKSRESVAKAMNCKSGNLVFTSGGSEAINMAILSAVHKNRRVGKHIVCTQIEHKATLSTLKTLEAQGYEITRVAPNAEGNIDTAAVILAVREDTALVTIMAVNSETGAALPTKEIAQEIKLRKSAALVHVDAVQALMKIPFDAKAYDYASVSGHKIGACKGVGALYCKDIKAAKPLIFGGGQESGLRGGTEGLPQIASFGAACDYRAENFEKSAEHMRGLMHMILSGLKRMPCAVRVHLAQNHAPHILNISPVCGRSEVIVRVMSDEGVFVSGGSACTKGKKSYVLAAMGVSSDEINAAIRISLCPETNEEDIKAMLSALEKAITMFM